MKIGELDVVDVKKGSNNILKIFLGETKVWEKQSGEISGFIYVGGGTSPNTKIKKYSFPELQFVNETQSTTRMPIKALLVSQNYLYYAGAGDLKIAKLPISDISATPIISEVSEAGPFTYMVEDGSFLYSCSGGAGDRVSKWDIDTLSYVSGTADDNGDINALCNLGNYVYSVGTTPNNVRRISKTGYPMPYSLEGPALSQQQQMIVQDGSFLYSGGGNQTIIKTDPTTLATVATSYNFGIGIYGVAVDENYVYGVGYSGTGASKIQKLLKSNLTFVSESGNVGLGALFLLSVGNYIIVCGISVSSGHTLKVYNKDTMSFVNSLDFGAQTWRVVFNES
jgi:hypothetical protein